MWSRISLLAIFIAFMAEVGVDILRDNIVLMVLLHGSLTPDATQEELRKLLDAVTSQTNYLLISLALGTASTVGGGYLAARLAKSFPYYNGLAIGLLGVLFQAVMPQSGHWWFDLLGYVTTIPAAIYGAHLAKRRLALPP